MCCVCQASWSSLSLWQALQPFRRIQTTEYLKAFINLKSLIYQLLNSGHLITNFQKSLRPYLLTDSKELLVTAITKPLTCSEFPQRYCSMPPSLGSLRKILSWVSRLDLHNFLEDKNLSQEHNPSACEQKCYFKLAFNLQAEQLFNLLQVRSTNLSNRLKSLHLLNHFCGDSLWSTSTKICRQF